MVRAVFYLWLSTAFLGWSWSPSHAVEPGECLPWRDVDGIVGLLVQLGDFERLTGNQEEAVVAYGKAISLDALNGAAIRGRGLSLKALGEFERAAKDFEFVMATDRTDAVARAHRAFCIARLGDPEGGLAECNRAVEMNSQDAIVIATRGIVRHLNQNPRGAIEDYSASLRLDAEQANIHRLRSFSYKAIGDTARANADLQAEARLRAQAEREDEAKLNRFREVKNKLDSAYKEGVRLRREWKYREARDQYLVAIEASRTIRADLTVEGARLLDGLARCYEDSGNYGDAEPLYRESLEMLEVLLDPFSLDVVLLKENLGQLYLKLGQPELARCLFEEAVHARKQLGDEVKTANSQNSLAAVYEGLGEESKGRELLEAVVATLDKRLPADDINADVVRSNLARAYESEGRLTEAEKLFLASRDLKLRSAEGRRRLASTYFDLGHLSERKNQWTEAEDYYNQAILNLREHSKDHPTLAFYLTAMADLSARRKLVEKAIEQFDEARKLFVRHASGALAVLPQAEQLNYLSNQYRPHFDAALSFAIDNRSNQLVCNRSAEWVLNAKGIALQTLATRELLASKKGQFAPQLALELIGVQNRIATLREVGEEPAADLMARERELSDQLKEFAPLFARLDKWVELPQIRDLLPKDALLIEIVKFRQVEETDGMSKDSYRYGVWLIPPAGKGDVSVKDLGDATPIDAAIKHARDLLDRGPRRILVKGPAGAIAEVREKLSDVAKLTVAPIEPVFEDYPRLLVSNDSELWLIPWAALPLNDGNYLLKRHTVNYLVSGRDLSAGRVADSGKTAFVLLNPAFDAAPKDDVNAAALNEVERKLRDSIAARLPVWGKVDVPPDAAQRMLRAVGNLVEGPIDLHTGVAASKSICRTINHPRVAWLNTHGFAFGGEEGNQHRTSPLVQCGLIMAGANRRVDAATDGFVPDGVLWGSDIVTLDLRGTDLVVIGACETGVGSLHAGEGVASLRQAFQIAGADGVISSLWMISKAEGTLMLFDQFWSTLRSDPAAALRDSQWAMIGDGEGPFSHPFYWSGFTVTGALPAVRRTTP